MHISSCKTNTSIQTFTHMCSYHQHNACNTHAETHTHACTHARTHAHTHTHTHTHTMCMYVHTNTHMCTHTLHKDTHTCSHAHMYAHRHTHMWVVTWIHPPTNTHNLVYCSDQPAVMLPLIISGSFFRSPKAANGNPQLATDVKEK